MLDLSAAFETVHHGFLLNIVNSKLGLDCIALQWFDSYLKNRSYRVSVNSQNRFTQRQDFLRAFVSGHYYLNVYASGIFDIVKEHLPQIHCYCRNSGRRILNYIYHLTQTPAFCCACYGKLYFTPPTWPPFLSLLLQHGRREVM